MVFITCKLSTHPVRGFEDTLVSSRILVATSRTEYDSDILIEREAGDPLCSSMRLG